MQQTNDLETLFTLEKEDCMELAKMASMTLGERRKLINGIKESVSAKRRLKDISPIIGESDGKGGTQAFQTGLRRRAAAAQVGAKPREATRTMTHKYTTDEPSGAEESNGTEAPKKSMRNAWRFQCVRSVLFIAIFLVLHTATQHFVLNPMFRPAPRAMDPQMLNRMSGQSQGFTHGGGPPPQFNPSN